MKDEVRKAILEQRERWAMLVQPEAAPRGWGKVIEPA